jgi:hypothetical protein
MEEGADHGRILPPVRCFASSMKRCVPSLVPEVNIVAPIQLAEAAGHVAAAL